MNQKHFDCLVNIYHSAPINQIYNPKMAINLGEASVEMKILEKYVLSMTVLGIQHIWFQWIITSQSQKVYVWLLFHVFGVSYLF